MSFLEIITYSLREYIPRISTSDECILNPLHLPWLLLLMELFFGQSQYFLSCVLRGCGLQILGSILSTTCFGFIGLVIGAIFVVMLDMGAAGFLIGLIVGAAVAFVLYILIIICINWEKRSKIAQNLAKPKSTAENHAMVNNSDPSHKERNSDPSHQEDHATINSTAPDVNEKNQKKSQHDNSEKNGENEACNCKNDCREVSSGYLKKGVETAKMKKNSARDLLVKIIAVVVIVSVTATAICIGNLFVYKWKLCDMLDYLNSANDTIIITKISC